MSQCGWFVCVCQCTPACPCWCTSVRVRLLYRSHQPEGGALQKGFSLSCMIHHTPSSSVGMYATESHGTHVRHSHSQAMRSGNAFYPMQECYACVCVDANSQVVYVFICGAYVCVPCCLQMLYGGLTGAVKALLGKFSLCLHPWRPLNN